MSYMKELPSWATCANNPDHNYCNPTTAINRISLYHFTPTQLHILHQSTLPHLIKGSATHTHTFQCIMCHRALQYMLVLIAVILQFIHNIILHNNPTRLLFAKHTPRNVHVCQVGSCNLHFGDCFWFWQRQHYHAIKYGSKNVSTQYYTKGQ